MAVRPSSWLFLRNNYFQFSSVHVCSFTKFCPTLFNPQTIAHQAPPSSVQFSHSVMSDSLQPHGLQHARPPCHHQLPEFTQTHVHWAGDAIQPSHPLSSPSPPTFNLSQHPSLFKCVSSSHQVAKVLELQLQHQSFPWIFRTDFL